MPSLLTRGNRKLGASIWHFDLPAGPQASCPGASEYCAAVCYARKGHYLFGSVQRKYADNFERLTVNPSQLTRDLAAELSNLPAGSVVRLHTSGDFVSPAYVRLWHRLALAHPSIRFYAYTRSWTVPTILAELEDFRALPNVTVWASHDPTMGTPPAGWPVARIVASWTDAPSEAHCPEQTGKRASCAECGLCFNPKLRPNARLAFKLH